MERLTWTPTTMDIRIYQDIYIYGAIDLDIKKYVGITLDARNYLDIENYREIHLIPKNYEAIDLDASVTSCVRSGSLSSLRHTKIQRLYIHKFG